MSDGDPIVGVSKVSEKGLVRIPFEIREKMDPHAGTKMILMVENDMIVLRKAEVVFQRKEQPGILGRLRSVFSKLPIRDIEE